MALVRVFLFLLGKWHGACLNLSKILNIYPKTYPVFLSISSIKGNEENGKWEFVRACEKEGQELTWKQRRTRSIVKLLNIVVGVDGKI